MTDAAWAGVAHRAGGQAQDDAAQGADQMAGEYPGAMTHPTVVGAATDVGRLRTVNEDGCIAISPVFIVVDGMGGHAAGQAASRAAIEALHSLVGVPITSIDQVVDAVAAAQAAIVSIPSHAAFLPGATVAGAVIAELPDPDPLQPPQSTWLVFNIGDARVYLLRYNILSQITRDHSQVQVLIDSGELTAQQARRDPRRNVVTRALGGGIADTAIPDLYTLAVEPGDRLLVCSDGLSDELDDEALATILAAGFPAQRTAELLVAASLEEGGHDNTTALVVDVPLPEHR